MAEAVFFSVASKLLSTISSPAFKFAYENGLSIWEAADELDKLKTTIETVQAVLIDAERKQEGSAAVKSWITRVSDVLYDADDLFDEVVTDSMLQQINTFELLRKVQVSLFKLNPVVSRNSISIKVKAIRKSLNDISTDMSGFQFVLCHKEEDMHTSRIEGERERGCLVDSKKVIGIDEEMKSILEMMLLKDLEHHVEPIVISIVGIREVGEETLAQLVYNDDQVKNIFPRRWFACISDTSDEKKVIGKIFESMCEETYFNFTVGQLQARIRGSIEGEKFLLVLEDVWDDDRSRWQDRLSLLSGGAKGSMIIVTTRSSSVAVAVGALKTHHLGGLSDDDSWDLFQRVAFPLGKENDRNWIDVGREILKKCSNVPLAITSIGDLLSTKSTLGEWESFRDGQLSNQSGDPVMKALKYSYDSLPSNLKHCFAYCSLFPKDYNYKVQMLIYLWNAQGYIKLNNEMQTVEEVGHLYFMELLRRGFFQEGVEDRYGEIESCKVHDLMHDLAQNVAGEEIKMVTMPPSNQSKHSARHVCVALSVDSWEIVAPLLDIKRVRSVALMTAYPRGQANLDQRFTSLKCVRALSLSNVSMDNVSSSIGELKHLRYLDLSKNSLKTLPDSITKLLNLVTLNLDGNYLLRELPKGFRKLINLRYLNLDSCTLKHMPPGMWELTSLRYLTTFKVGKASGLEALARLEQLKGKLKISFLESVTLKNDECWKLPVSPEELLIRHYPGMRVPNWANRLPSLPNLRSLILNSCVKVKYLPPLRHLPHLMCLHLLKMHELEYVEEERLNNASFFPCLEQLLLADNPKLKGWWRQVEETTPLFPSLTTLGINNCPNLDSIPLCPPGLLRKLEIRYMHGDCSDGVLQQLLSNTGSSPFPSSLQEIDVELCGGITSFSDQLLISLRSFSIAYCPYVTSLHMVSPHLRALSISRCHGLESVRLEALATSLHIFDCSLLKDLHIAHPNVLEELNISSCPEFDKGSLDWDSFPNLRKLEIHWNFRLLGRLPDCLVHLQNIGQLEIQFQLEPQPTATMELESLRRINRYSPVRARVLPTYTYTYTFLSTSETTTPTPSPSSSPLRSPELLPHSSFHIDLRR